MPEKKTGYQITFDAPTAMSKREQEIIHAFGFMIVYVEARVHQGPYEPHHAKKHSELAASLMNQNFPGINARSVEVPVPD